MPYDLAAKKDFIALKAEADKLDVADNEVVRKKVQHIENENKQIR